MSYGPNATPVAEADPLAKGTLTTTADDAENRGEYSLTCCEKSGTHRLPPASNVGNAPMALPNENAGNSPLVNGGWKTGNERDEHA